MKHRCLFARKCGVAGAYFSIIPFLLFGLIIGARYGLEAGSFVTKTIFSGTAHLEFIDRLIMGGSMVFGIIIAGAVLVSSCFALCWSAGYILGRAKGPGDINMDMDEACEATDVENG